MSETINTNPNWVKLNEEWESSGLSQVNFCKQKDINLAHFTYQRSKILKKRIYKKPVEFASVKLTSPALSSGMSPEIVIEFPGQIKLHIPPSEVILTLVLNILREQV